MDDRTRRLTDFCQSIYRNEGSKEFYQKHIQDIQTITPLDVFLIQNEQMEMGMSTKEMLTSVDKLLNIFHKPLMNYHWEKPAEGTFLHILMEENSSLKNLLDEFKGNMRQRDIHSEKDVTRAFIESTEVYNIHFQKLERIFFPYLEKKTERFKGLKLFWDLHEEIRKRWKDIHSLLGKEDTDGKDLQVEIGKLYFDLYGAISKQEKLLFPATAELLDDNDFEKMLDQSFDYGFVYMDTPKRKGSVGKDDLNASGEREGLKRLFADETGKLDVVQLELLLNALPVDLTYVDENDKVAYLTNPKHSIFPRSAAVLDREVGNCHPPERVHVVEEILEEFKSGKQDDAEFWIKMNDMSINVRYVVLRDSEGNYRGTLEIKQEIRE